MLLVVGRVMWAEIASFGNVQENVAKSHSYLWTSLLNARLTKQDVNCIDALW